MESISKNKLPKWILHLYLLFVFFLPFTKVSLPVIGLYELTLGDILILLISAIVILFNNRIDKSLSVYLKTFYLFFFMIGASIIMARSFRLYFLELLPMIFAFFIIISTIIIFSSFDKKFILTRIRLVLLISLFISCLPVYVQIFITHAKNPLFYDRYGWRYTFLAQNPNQYGVYLILFFFILTLITLRYYREKLNQVFLLQILFIPAALFSGSKTATIIFTLNFALVGFILFLTLSMVKKAAVFPLMVLILSFSLPKIVDFMSTQGGQVTRALEIFERLSSEEEIIESDSPTGHSQSEGINLFMKYPFLGVGLANKPMHSNVRTEIHNTYIKFLAETGIIGFSGFLIMFLLPLISVSFSRIDFLTKGSFILFYMLFAAMNWPHMLLRQRWVWFFMVMCYIISRVDVEGNIQKSRLKFLN